MPVSPRTEFNNGEAAMTDAKIKATQEANKVALTANPAGGIATAVLEATIGEGLACDVSDGTNATLIDMPETFGGTGQGPTPGFHARAAVAACVAIGIKATAIRVGLRFDEVKVRVEMDFDDGALYGLGENTAAPFFTRLVVDLKTKHSEVEVAPVIDLALETDPFFLALRDPQQVETDIRII